uniref:Macaca fascicularis brain cDNA clone: QmoA-10719, similar to human chemokine (C-C motif) ligand 5 (CCL5), mRNA, RefSeq: NM_002985.2 n=1 Tax=Macaca fascicularis TaxID=9541 RepID=I7GP72_MACFA|nr:unnamed protein product [Macaca fascicularis]
MPTWNEDPIPFEALANCTALPNSSSIIKRSKKCWDDRRGPLHLAVCSHLIQMCKNPWRAFVFLSYVSAPGLRDIAGLSSFQAPTPCHSDSWVLAVR